MGAAPAVAVASVPTGEGVVIKLVLGVADAAETHLWTTPLAQLTWSGLQAKAASVTGGSPPTRFSYVDTDGDTVCLSSEADVGELLARLPAPPLRLLACSGGKVSTAPGPHNECALPDGEGADVENGTAVAAPTADELTAEAVRKNDQAYEFLLMLFLFWLFWLTVWLGV